jgi:hypothetical protein
VYKQRFSSFLDKVQALPIFVDDMFNEVVAVALSVTFGEVTLQAVFSRHGLAIAADMMLDC